MWKPVSDRVENYRQQRLKRLNEQLIGAAINGDTRKVARLMDSGADPNARDNKGRTVLMYAVFNGHTEVVKLMIVHWATT